MSESFPNPNEEQNDQAEQTDSLDVRPEREVFEGLGSIDEVGLRNLIDETRRKGLDENPQ